MKNCSLVSQWKYPIDIVNGKQFVNNFINITFLIYNNSRSFKKRSITTK